MTRDEFLALPENKKTAAVAKANLEKIMGSSFWRTVRMGSRLRAITEETNEKAALVALRLLADDINHAQSRHAVCFRGCSHCCYIANIITDLEAERIGRFVHRAPAKPASVLGEPDGLATCSERYFGVACPFLHGRICTVYEARPLACRTHANIGDNSDMCRHTVVPEFSLVMSLDLKSFWMTAAFALKGRVHADIRDFFPSKPKGPP
jgi:Fe-S-cluster containining protein